MCVCMRDVCVCVRERECVCANLKVSTECMHYYIMRKKEGGGNVEKVCGCMHEMCGVRMCV